MTKQKAIHSYCLDCSGNSHKEVTLCHLFDCPLWEYRCGCHIKSSRYKTRIESAFKRYKEEFEILAEMGIEIARFSP